MSRYFAALFVAALLCGCSGGGGSSVAPQPKATLGGAGAPAVFDQKITFVIDIPAAAPAVSMSARRTHPVRPAAIRVRTTTPVVTTPYVSPRTGSVVLTLAEVDGVSPQQAPPPIAPINVPPSCQGSAAGCKIPVANVPAALGTDRYLVTTFTGSNATGSLISTGFADVAVPVKANANPAIGGAAALSIGGFVANIALAPASLSFIEGTPSDANLLIQALDAGGAAIVGAAQYATPITVSVGDAQNFSLNGSASVAVSGPLQKPLSLHYGGGSSFGTLVQATSQDGSGVAVSATPIAANVLPPGYVATPPSGTLPTSIPTSLATARPTPRPGPTPPPTQALSLYVADALADTVSEYRIASQIAAGIAPNPAATPSRVFKFDPTLAQSKAIGSGGLSCQPAAGSPGAGNGTAGIAVDPNSGMIFVFPNCTDGTNGFVFGYPAQSVGTPAPTIYDPFAPAFGFPNGLAFANGLVYAGYSNFNNEALYGFPVRSNGLPPSVAVGSTCIAEFGSPSPGCFNDYAAGFGVDGNGFWYLPAYWNDAPTGEAAFFQNPAAVLTIRASGTNATVTPYAAIAGIQSTVGGSNAAPFAATVDGSTLYVLTGSAQLSTAASAVFPGLSACPPPSANAPINPFVDPNTNNTQCADMQQHLYIAAYSITGQLLGPAAYGTDVDLIPNFLIGGDRVGGFGCDGSGASPGQFLAASRGYVYVLNLTQTCQPGGGGGVLAPEVDVYNTNGISGAHTDIAPVFKLPLTTGFPLAIAVGPSGSVIGGQALLRAPRSRSYRPDLYGHRRAASKPRRHNVILRKP